MPERTLTVTEADHDFRLDVFITRSLPDEIPSRMFVKKLMEAGRVYVNDKPVKHHYKVRTADMIRVDIQMTDYPDDRIKPEQVSLDIVFEDDDILALNKPSGMTVHPAAGNYGGTLVNALVHHFGELSDVNGERRPGIVHRLDKETSGVILVAKTNFAHARLAKQFEAHTIEKQYMALVEGEVQYDEGVVEAAIEQHPKYHDMRRVTLEEGEGKEATTYYTVLKRSKGVSVVALFPETGRTHQLRLHMRHLGHPILGDDKYGHKSTFNRLALHAQAIFFKHPRTEIPIEVSVPLPPEFLSFLA